MEDNGRISATDLMSKLALSKKVMEKVDNKNYETGHINANVLRSDPEQLIAEGASVPRPSSVNIPNINTQIPPSVSKIENSKLPESIKRAMIEHPISQISLTDGLDLSIINGAKRLIEQDTKSQKPQPNNVRQPQQETSFQQNNQRQYINEGFDPNSLQIMIENTIRKVLDEKLTQILSAQDTTAINENLAIRVGDSIFKGKLTKVNKTKK